MENKILILIAASVALAIYLSWRIGVYLQAVSLSLHSKLDDIHESIKDIKDRLDSIDDRLSEFGDSDDLNEKDLDA